MPQPVDLAYAIGLAPEAAIAYFRAKGYQIAWSWLDVWQEAHAKAFTVAGVMKLDVLQDIRSAVDTALAKGETYSEFENQLKPTLQAKGWWGRNAQIDMNTGAMAGQALTAWRLKTIFQTNLQTAYQAGRYQSFMGNVTDRPYWMYVAVMDRRTRPQHAALNGRVFRANDPFWDSFYPPNGFNCRCRVRALDDDNLRERDLALSSSQGKLSKIDVPTSRQPGAPKTTVERFEYAPRKYVAPDPGWSYNPGKVKWQPDLTRYDADLVKKYDDRTQGR